MLLRKNDLKKGGQLVSFRATEGNLTLTKLLKSSLLTISLGIGSLQMDKQAFSCKTLIIKYLLKSFLVEKTHKTLAYYLSFVK